MHLSAAVSLTAYLNACRHGPLSTEVAARAVVGDHAAHHVVDVDGLLGLDPMAANELDTAMSAALLIVDSDWVLTLPRSGRLAPLAGPPHLTALALDAGAAVVASSGGVAWVPQAVGPAVQWQVVVAHRPGPITEAAEADRRLRESVVETGRTVTNLPLTGADRPDIEAPPVLPAVYGRRAQRLVARSWQLVHALDVALTDDGGALHVHAVDTRHRALVALRDAAETALTSAVSWTGADQGR